MDYSSRPLLSNIGQTENARRIVARKDQRVLVNVVRSYVQTRKAAVCLEYYQQFYDASTKPRKLIVAFW